MCHEPVSKYWVVTVPGLSGVPSVITCNCKQHITCPGHRRDHGPPLTPLSCKQSATDKHFTRNPLSSQQPQSAPVCAMPSSSSSVYCFIANNTSADLIMMSPRHMWHMPALIERIILCQKTWRAESWDDINKWPDARQCARLIIRQEMRDQSYVKITSGASLTKLNINISPR